MDSPLPVRLITDKETAFAFLLGVLFNQQMRARDAWLAPYRLGQRIGGLTPKTISRMELGDLENHFSESPAIHPFIRVMARNTHEIAYIIVNQYDGDVRNLWAPVVSASEFISRLTSLPGIGEHKARIALFVATVQLGVEVKKDDGEYSIHSCGSLVQLFHPVHEPTLIE